MADDTKRPSGTGPRAPTGSGRAHRRGDLVLDASSMTVDVDASGAPPSDDLIIDTAAWDGSMTADSVEPGGLHDPFPDVPSGGLRAGAEEWHPYPRALMYTYTPTPTVRVEAWRDLTAHHWQVRRLVVLAPALAGLELAPEGARHRVAKAVGVEESQLGDPAFDEAVWVSAGSTAQLLCRFDADLRAQLVEVIGWGARVGDGRLYLNHPHHDDPTAPGWEPKLMLPPFCALADALIGAPLVTAHGLDHRIRTDPSPAVRARATAAWLAEVDWHHCPATDDVLVAALVILLDDKTMRPQAIERLAEVGDERAVAPLTALARGWFGGDEAKAAGAAVEAITRRLGGLRTGGLSVSKTLEDGGLSLDDDPVGR